MRALGRPAVPGGRPVGHYPARAASTGLHRSGDERGDVEVAQRWTARGDGSPLRLLVVRPAVPRAGVPGVVWIHGGGYAIGTPEGSTATARRLVAVSNCVVVLPDYRLSTEAPYPAALDDCYDALRWLGDNAAGLGVADDQLVVGGESVRGGLTAAVTLLARDRGEIAAAFEMPLHPMIDDRVTASSRENTSTTRCSTGASDSAPPTCPSCSRSTRRLPRLRPDRGLRAGQPEGPRLPDRRLPRLPHRYRAPQPAAR